MGLDFGMAFDEQGNPIPSSGGSDSANNLGDIKRDEHKHSYHQTVVELCNATLKCTQQTRAHHRPLVDAATPDLAHHCAWGPHRHDCA